jgi:hypothetical protein
MIMKSPKLHFFKNKTDAMAFRWHIKRNGGKAYVTTVRNPSNGKPLYRLKVSKPICA